MKLSDPSPSILAAWEREINMCFVTILARQHERLSEISCGLDDQSDHFDAIAQAMHALRMAATHHVPECAEGWVFQAETLEIGHKETYWRLHKMLLEHFQALVAAQPAAPVAA
jgi:hypothetical protein